MQIKFTEKQLQAARRFLKENRVEEIHFSGPTYQVRLKGLRKDEWCFLQLDEAGKVKDGFCSCEQGDASCEHLAAAWLALFKEHSPPLHARFARSLWNQLGQITMKRVGESPEVFRKVTAGSYSCDSDSGRSLFFIKLKTQTARRYFQEIVYERGFETEETSLKFSNLTAEEIAYWKEGRPSFELRYELSFWADLAKWLMKLQEEGEYDLSFGYAKNGLPNLIKAVFSDVEVRFYLSEAHLPAIIPALATLRSPLTVHSFDEEAVEQITYDEDKCAFQVHLSSVTSAFFTKAEDKELQGAYSIEDWLYVPGDGFYPKEKNFLLLHPLVPKEEISQMMEGHLHLLQRYLKGTSIQEVPVTVSYQLFFDAENNLHLVCYLFEPGDLQQEGSAYFGKWAYLKGDGFYELEGVHFNEDHLLIPSASVGDFVSENRLWLNVQEGFHTHLASLETFLTYSLDERGVLSFASQSDLLTQQAFTRDFGDWVYVAGEGFYSKRLGRLGAYIQPGVVVLPFELSLFVQMHADELQQIRGFFSATSPILAIGLSLSLAQSQQIIVKPQFRLRPGYQIDELRFFDDLVYVKGEGFHFLPWQRLPSRFRRQVIIPKSELDNFFSNELLTIAPYIFEMDRELKKPGQLTLLIEELDENAAGNLDAKLVYSTDMGKVSVKEVWEAIHKKQRYFFSKAGFFDLEDSRLQWLRPMPKELVKDEFFRLSPLEWIRLQAWQPIEREWNSKEAKESGEPLWNSLTSFTSPTEPILIDLKSSLRPYQKIGVDWLWFLYTQKMAGLLCDDMGLGKTHQAMALLAAAHHGKRACSLIVCPTSVIYHWEEKLGEFLPHLKLFTFYGTGRSAEGLQDCDIVLTSYGILRLEIDALQKIPFEIAIFDEVQVAKNHTSQTYRALSMVKSAMRLGLTGTPIENRLRELKALFDLILPGYMPSDSYYRDLFVIPIEKEHDAAKKMLLQRLIKPFVLRRKKSEVLTDLPEKTEEIGYCDLSDKQHELYRQVLEPAQDTVVAALKDAQRQVSYVSLFALLVKLKQICDHPAVFLNDAENYEDYQSGKWELFVELLEEARESQQKVVVFTHYLAMMDIIEYYLKKHQIGFAAIRGQTANRREELRRFKEDPACEVFIGSLQAVGLGVDLTAASVVIHYDRWWTAARENQATDRVHRIGQQKGVQVFKLVTKKTLEERIDQLITEKGALMEEIIGSDDSEQLKQLNREEWIELLTMF